ncbi:MAG: helix-turn-helix domain-containing protein [Candidatus Cyclobacteriaceae bacterium M2_1C_046]
MEKYGELFLNEIKKFIASNTTLKNIKGKTYLETFTLLKEGLSVEEVAKKRSLNPATIYNHIAYLYEKGEKIDISEYISEQEINTILQAWYKLDKTDSLKEIHEYLNEKYEFHTLRLGLAFIKGSESVKDEAVF